MKPLTATMSNIDEIYSLPCGASVPYSENGIPVLAGVDRAQAWRCAKCGYGYFQPPPFDRLARQYREEYADNAASWYNLEDDYSPLKTEPRASYVLGLAEKYLGRRQNLLCHETGCAFGGTVAKLNELGCNATGADLNSTAIQAGIAKKGTPLTYEYDPDFLRRTGRVIDILYSYHTLEHMPSPSKFLQDLRPHLRGIAIFCIPNGVSFLQMKEGHKKNPWFIYPEHLHMFTPASLPCLANSAGYKLLDMQTAMVADNPKETEALLAKFGASEPDIYKAQLGLELQFVLTPADSDIAQRHASQIEQVTNLCESLGERECTILA